MGPAQHLLGKSISGHSKQPHHFLPRGARQQTGSQAWNFPLCFRTASSTSLPSSGFVVVCLNLRLPEAWKVFLACSIRQRVQPTQAPPPCPRKERPRTCTQRGRRGSRVSQHHGIVCLLFPACRAVVARARLREARPGARTAEGSGRPGALRRWLNPLGFFLVTW